VKSHGDVAAGAVIGGILGAIVGGSLAGRHDGGGAVVAGAALGAAGGAAVAASTGSNETSPGCPPGYVVRHNAPTYAYSYPDYYYAAPGWYRPWIYTGGAWIYRPYPYHDWYWHRYRGPSWYRDGWRGGPGWRGDGRGWHDGGGWHGGGGMAAADTTITEPIGEHEKPRGLQSRGVFISSGRTPSHDAVKLRHARRLDSIGPWYQSQGSPGSILMLGWVWRTRLPGGTEWVSQTLPPMTEHLPMVMRPRMVAPA
jgi:hypothetical protein